MGSMPAVYHTYLLSACLPACLPAFLLQVICQLPPMLSKHLLSVTPVVAQVSKLLARKRTPPRLSALVGPPARLHCREQLGQTQNRHLLPIV